MYLIINMGEFTLNNQVSIANEFGEVIEFNNISQDETSDYVIGKLMDYPDVDRIEISGFQAQTDYMKEELSNVLESCYSERNIEIEVI